MFRVFLLLAVLLFRVSVPGVAIAADPVRGASSPWDTVRVINKGWTYVESDRREIPDTTDSNGIDVDLPHTWNALDSLETSDYRRSASWYLKTFQLDLGDFQARRLFVRIGAAGQQADVYCNGHLLGRHAGGYTAFTFEITSHVVEGENRIAVRVDNAENHDVPPLAGDVNMYGGLYRAGALKFCRRA